MAKNKPFVIPYKTKWGFTLEQIDSFCPNCNKPLSDVRGKIVEFQHCVEVRGSGICYHCKLFVHLDATRIYDDNRFSFCGDDGVWQMRKVNTETNKTKIFLATLLTIEIAIFLIYYFWK